MVQAMNAPTHDDIAEFTREWLDGVPIHMVASAPLDEGPGILVQLAPGKVAYLPGHWHGWPVELESPAPGESA
jgi:hypothetical protein